MSLFIADDFSDDQGIPFSQFDYYISFDEVRAEVDSMVWENLQYYSALYCYERLVKSLQVQAIIVDNLQTLIEASYEI